MFGQDAEHVLLTTFSRTLEDNLHALFRERLGDCIRQHHQGVFVDDCSLLRRRRMCGRGGGCAAHGSRDPLLGGNDGDNNGQTAGARNRTDVACFPAAVSGGLPAGRYGYVRAYVWCPFARRQSNTCFTARNLLRVWWLLCPVELEILFRNFSQEPPSEMFYRDLKGYVSLKPCGLGLIHPITSLCSHS